MFFKFEQAPTKGQGLFRYFQLAVGSKLEILKWDADQFITPTAHIIISPNLSKFFLIVLLQSAQNNFLFLQPPPGYINENGTLNLPRFEKFLASLSVREMDRFDDIYSDNKWLEGKTARKKKTKNNTAKGGASGFETIITDTPGQLFA